MKEKGTLTQGKARFVFQVLNNEIVLEADHKGNESVIINGALLESKRSFRLSGSHSVAVGNRNYELVVKVRNLFTGVIDAKLIERGNVISHQRAKVKLGEKFKVLSFILLLGCCFMLGIAIGNELLPIWLCIPLFVVVVMGTASIRGRNYVIQKVGT